MRLPDEDVQPIWEKMTKEEQHWYKKFKQATQCHDWNALQWLCDEAPSDQYERLYAEIAYEANAFMRARYEVPKSHNSTYSEWDYSWAAPKRSANKRGRIDNDYAIETDNQEFYTAPGKKVKFK